MRNGLAIGTDIEVGELRRHARLEVDGRVAARLDYTEAGMLRQMKGLDLSYQKTQPRHPQSDPAAQRDFQKGGRRER